jgi:hypothetical protein
VVKALLRLDDPERTLASNFGKLTNIYLLTPSHADFSTCPLEYQYAQVATGFHVKVRLGFCAFMYLRRTGYMNVLDPPGCGWLWNVMENAVLCFFFEER